MTLLLLMTLLSFQEGKTVFVDRVAVKVNDKIVTERELLISYKQRRDAALAKYKGAELDQQLKLAWEESVQDAEETLLMFEKAGELGFALSRDDVRGELISMKESRGLSDEEFEETIENQTGMTLVELVDLRQRENSAQMVFQSQVLRKMVIEDNEIAKYYEGHLAEFMNTATYRIAEIVCLKDSANPLTAQEKVQACLSELQAGADFAEVAMKYSDSLSKESGGDLGLVEFGDLLGKIEDEVKGMTVGAFSDILETDGAYFIIKLHELNPESPKPIDEVHEQITNTLRQPRTQAELKRFVEKLRAEFSVKTYIKEIPWYLEY